MYFAEYSQHAKAARSTDAKIILIKTSQNKQNKEEYYKEEYSNISIRKLFIYFLMEQKLDDVIDENKCWTIIHIIYPEL